MMIAIRVFVSGETGSLGEEKKESEKRKHRREVGEEEVKESIYASTIPKSGDFPGSVGN